MILQCNPFEGYVIQTGIKSRLFSVDVNTDLGRRRKRISLHMVNGQHIRSKLILPFCIFVCRITFMVDPV